MTSNLRGAYMKFEHDWAESWQWLEQWQPSVVVLLLPGNMDPMSVSLEKVIRVHRMHPRTIIVLRVWEVDDNDGEALALMEHDPIQKATDDALFWAYVFSRLPARVREKCVAHLINEPHPRQHGAQIRDYTDEALAQGIHDGVSMMGYNFSVGEPPLAGEHQFDWPYFAALENDFIAGNHIVGFHEYFQPEGMYGVWTDDQGKERKDWGFLVGRHLKSGIKRARMCWSEWGLEGSIYNRHTGRGWLNYPELWWPARYADEFVESCRIAAPNVIGICPFIDDHGGWKDFHLGTAYSELLARKHLCERVTPGSPPTEPPVAPSPPTPPPPPPPPPPPTSPSGIVDPRVAQAILSVESGRAFDAEGRPVIRFEAHIFERELGNKALFDQYFRYGSPPWTGQEYRDGDQWKPIHTGRQTTERDALQVAAVLKLNAAYRSISVGIAQIMGFNHAAIGYSSPFVMYEAFSDPNTGYAAQVIGFFNFLLHAGLLDAMRNKDWRTIALRFNGPGQVDLYARLLREAYEHAG